MNVPVSLTDAVEEGTYQASFSVAFPLTIKTPYTIDAFNYHVSLDTYTVDTVNGSTFLQWTVTKFRGASGGWRPVGSGSIEVVPAVGVVLGVVVGLFGLVLVYLTLTKLERVVDSPGVNVALVAAGIVAVYIVFKQL